jgi:hypothetical protein
MRLDRNLPAKGPNVLRQQVVEVWSVYFEPLVALRKRIVARWLEAKPKPYVAIFLDPESQKRLILWWSSVVEVPLLKELKAHHMTLQFNPRDEDIANFPLGELGTVKIVGYAADEKGQAVLVRSSVPSRNQHPHITVAVASGVSAAYSNDLLARGHTPLNGPRLTGIVDVRQD